MRFVVTLKCKKCRTDRAYFNVIIDTEDLMDGESINIRDESNKNIMVDRIRDKICQTYRYECCDATEFGIRINLNTDLSLPD